MEKYLIYILNILLIALPLAIFEICIEPSGGWGSSWLKNKWYAKPFIPENKIVKFFVRIFNVESPLNYHLFMFGFIIPAIFLLEYIFITQNIILLLSGFVAVLVFEDFLWFLLNWRFDSLKQLLKGPNGSIWWHKGWIKVSKNKYLPISYFIMFPISIILLLVV
ncbi:MAG: hypothetical protein PHZ07_03715 [Patescibacteria group bacterium]|nr:hypothetical protein [Patescibacteria group bacterium]MDD4304538.1 hypothetical protein [Patescibacteria group bacterium]MDD4695646.1 hypothetical protein [Patescibacteria group bacterium]